jgi:hypothetical protein
MKKHYYLEAFGLKREVTREEWIQAERAAGFRSKGGDNTEATGGFSSGCVSGSIEYVKTESDQVAFDNHAFALLQEVVMLGRNERAYKHLLKPLKEALAKSPHATEYVKNLTKDIL